MSNPAVPQHCPTPRELDDLELLVSGALAPLRAFNVAGSPVTLDLPAELAAAATIELVDPEGLPLATGSREADGSLSVMSLTDMQYGPFRRYYLTPAQVRSEHAGRTVVPVSGPLTDSQLELLRGCGPLLLLALVGSGTPDLSPVALLRATLRVAGALDDAVVVAVALASHGDAETDHALGVQVVANYAGDDPVIGLPEGGEVLPELADIVDFDLPPVDRQGLVLFFTGLSGSGKSTLARALMDRLLEQGVRTVTSLDGDVVRRNLSAGLTFSKADRETNIRRIGWVAAEISRHGGVAVVSPIAPFDETRQQVRAMVDEAGGAFFLVHVATPLEECERRDRKGLYAKARRGEIPEFTGISSPYEEPEDADVRVDTTGRTIEDALDDVLDALAEAGYLDLRPTRWFERGASHAHAVEVVERVATSEAERAASRRPQPTRPLQPRPPLKVLFVCTANICRSPYMEVAARALVTRRQRHLQQRRHPRLPRPADQPTHGRRPRGRRSRPQRLPQPATHPPDGRRGRPGAHCRGRAPLLHPRREPRGLPQGLHPGPVRRGDQQARRAPDRPRARAPRSASAAARPTPSWTSPTRTVAVTSRPPRLRHQDRRAPARRRRFA